MKLPHPGAAPFRALIPAILLMLLAVGCGGLFMSSEDSGGNAQLLDQVVTEENASTLAAEAREKLSYDEFRLIMAYIQRVHPNLPKDQLPIGVSLKTMLESQKDFERANAQAIEATTPAESPDSEQPSGQSASQAQPGSSASQPADPRPATPPPAQPAPAQQTQAVEPVQPPAARTVVVDEGTVLKIRLAQAISSKRNQDGDSFDAYLDEDLVVDGRLVAPDGSKVVGKLSNVESSGKVKGRATMAVTLSRLQVGDEVYSLRTNTLQFEAEGSGKEDAKKVGIGAGIGAVIGAIAGGGKGAAIGGAIGAGAGTGAVLATAGEEVEFGVEQLFSFQVAQDLEMQVVEP